MSDRDDWLELQEDIDDAQRAVDELNDELRRVENSDADEDEIEEITRELYNAENHLNWLERSADDFNESDQ